MEEDIPAHWQFRNAPQARSLEEAAESFIKSTPILVPHPKVDNIKEYRDEMGASRTDMITFYQTVLLKDNRIQKSCRITTPETNQHSLSFPWFDIPGGENLLHEKKVLEFLKANTSIPVPQVYDYYQSQGFEHLVLEKLPGETLRVAWPTLQPHEREQIADEVVAYLNELRKLTSPRVENRHFPHAATMKDFFRAHFQYVPTHPRIQEFVETNLSKLDEPEFFVFTHGILYEQNIMVKDGHVTGIINWGMGGYYPYHYEWQYNFRYGKNRPIEWKGMMSSRLSPSIFEKYSNEEIDIIYYKLEALLHALRGCQAGFYPSHREESLNCHGPEIGELLQCDWKELSLTYPEGLKHAFEYVEERIAP